MTRDEVIAYYKKLVIRIKGIVAEEGEALKKDRFSQSLEATEMAIRSLEAWDKVINTLKNWSDAKVSPKQRDVYFDCIELIEQTIKREVTESEGKE